MPRRFTLLPVVLFVLMAAANAQTLPWGLGPQKGFVFQISNQEAQRLLVRSKPDSIVKGMLHTLIDTFDVDKGWKNRPPKGHFILVRIQKNQVLCEYTSVFPYQVFLMKEYGALALQVLDLEGQIRQDAKVKLGSNRIRFDTLTKTYRLEHGGFTGRRRYATVELEGFRSVFNIEKHEVPTWDYHDYFNGDEGPDLYSYMITDKNRYKPNEKVRFKSYALSGARVPLRRALEVWLLNPVKPQKVGLVNPRRPGSYSDEIHLHDSLKLTLDKRYTLQLREKNGRVVASCNFRYEDYELFGNKLELKLKTEKQYHPLDNEVSIVATDVNGLMLKDATATIVVTTSSIRETFDPLVILPDTVLHQKRTLDPATPTVIPIPAALFGKSNTVYNVVVTVTNSENQRIEQSVSATHYFSQHEMVARFSSDSIIYELESSGKPVTNVPVKIVRDQLDSVQTTLPFKEKLNPVITQVRVETALASRTFTMRDLIPTLVFTGGIRKDSFKIALNNPQKLEVSWFVYQGNELLANGSGKALDYKAVILDRSSTFTAELVYSFGGQEQVLTKEYPFMDDRLEVSLNLPDKVYPGQKVDALIKVEDRQGNPVSNVDLTAFAATSKLGYYPPDLPYYGSTSSGRSKSTNYSKEDVNKRLAVLELDYRKWEQRARLDTMKYYQFTYPHTGLFKHAYTIADSTQFAPFVMKNGDAQQIYVIEVNNQPVYYSWTVMPPRYSFYVSPKKKSRITLRLYDRVLILDSIRFEAGKKTLMSLDLDHLPKGVEVVKLYPKSKKRRDRVPQFTPTELSRYTPFVAGFTSMRGKGYLESKSGFVPLFYGGGSNVVVVGPVAPGRQTLSGEGVTPVSYQHAGGFNYAFEENVVYKTDAKDLIPARLRRHRYDPSTKFSDLVLNKKQFLEARLEVERKWHARSIHYYDPVMRVTLLLPEEKEKTGIANVLFEECASGKLVSPCESYSSKTRYHLLPRGCHRVIVLYNSGRYFKFPGVDFRAHTKVVIDFNQQRLNNADDSSRGWLLRPPDNCHPETAPVRVFQVRQQKTAYGNVRGTVLSADDNSPLPGVNVVVKGTIDGTVTDVDGNFSLNVSQSPSTLVFSFIGFQTQEVEVQPGAVLAVTLQMDVMQLTEVVVTGYGTQQSSAVYGSIRIRGISSLKEVDEFGYKKDQNMPPSELPDENEIKDAEQRLYQELLALNSIRSNFSDVGFWEPALFTDKSGEAAFAVQFPDDITRWDATVYAMNRRLQTGTARKRILSYKPLIAELHVPPFLTRGDSVFMLGKVLNYTQDSTVRGEVKWKLGNREGANRISFSGFHSEKLFAQVVSTDTLKGRFVFTRDDGYLDGEERSVPVVDQGIIRADGTLGILKDTDIVTIHAERQQKTVVEILDNPLEIYSREAKHLIHYRYDCNEQLASKLLGLISHKAVMNFEGKPFRYEKDVQRIIDRLLRNQNQEFLWSWWDVSSQTSSWMSAHILRALKTAQQAGYPVNLDVRNLTSKASYRYEFQRKLDTNDADLLNALATWGVPLNYPLLVRKMDSLIYQKQWVKARKTGEVRWQTGYLTQKLLLIEVKQLINIPYQRDSLLRYKVEGLLGDVNFTDRASATWYYNDLTANTVAYRIVKREAGLNQLVIPMQMYFLKERQKNTWNTYHGSNVLMTVLPDLLQAGATSKKIAEVKLSGAVNKTLTKFPERIELAPGETLRIEKVSGVPLYYMQHVEERVTTAKTGVDGFTIQTTLENKKSTLQAGQPVNLHVDVTVKRDASMDYVMIEIPIPGSCSYNNRSQDRSKETHREYFKEKVVIFCENLRAGKHTFTVSLLPRFTGKFFQNPAQVSLMYVPVVNANTDLKTVWVE
ncbi:MAG: carboxypeptidase-like regulatory domain-containing protein [Cyclobacteriaceae bacterium]